MNEGVFHMFNRLTVLVSATALCACNGGGAEVRVGAAQGIPSIKGSQEFSIANYTCGMPITQQGYTVTTTVVGSSCEFDFDQVVTIIKDTDYQKIPDLKGSSNLLQSVEIQVNTLAFTDAATGTALDYNNYVQDASLKIDGNQVATKADLAKLPATITLTGAAIANIKTAVDARQPASVHATAVMVVPMSPKPPDRLKVDYDAQPTLVLGTGSINLGK
jgi:hypothetical protein